MSIDAVSIDVVSIDAASTDVTSIDATSIDAVSIDAVSTDTASIDTASIGAVSTDVANINAVSIRARRSFLPLDAENQLYGAVVGAENVIKDVGGYDMILEVVGDEEIVDAPADVPFAGAHAV